MQKDYKMFPPSVNWDNIIWPSRRPQMDFPVQVLFFTQWPVIHTRNHPEKLHSSYCFLCIWHIFFIGFLKIMIPYLLLNLVAVCNMFSG